MGKKSCKVSSANFSGFHSPPHYQVPKYWQARSFLNKHLVGSRRKKASGLSRPSFFHAIYLDHAVSCSSRRQLLAARTREQTKGPVIVNFQDQGTTNDCVRAINNSDSTPHASVYAANQAGSFYFPKPALTFREQINHMVENGLRVDDAHFAEERLADTNYYRLRGFWLTLEDENGRFREGVSFENIWDTYELDRALRLWLWKVISPIEVKLRTQFAYFTAHYIDPFGYLDEGNFKSAKRHSKSIENFERERDRARRQNVPYVAHNIDRYGQLLVWAAVEVMSFGTLSQLYGNLSPKAGATEGHQGVYTSVADAFGMKPVYLKSWMHHLTTIRNIAGHHDRFYNRVIAIRPRLLNRDARHQGDKEFPTLLIIKNIYELSWPEKWPLIGEELVDIIESHPRVDLRPMGFPEDWKTVLHL